MLVVIKGAGDLATGIACRLFRCGFALVMTETARPTTVRCTVAFSQAVYRGSAQVDPSGTSVEALRPDVVVDAVLAKRNLGTHLTDASCVVGVGPGFLPGRDCHAAVETQRGHDLGRVLWDRAPASNTGVPGEIGGYTVERLLRAPADGVFLPAARIGDLVEAGQPVGYVEGTPMRAQISGVLRGLLPDGTPVHTGMKAGDIDPRCRREHCFSVSDKARAVGGGVLEAILTQYHRKEGGTYVR